ncbi:MAG: UDP-N-acetylmuramoyl-L-alanine--D-glutamate ligase [bacterium]
MKLEELRGKKVVILALGKFKQGSGVAAAKFCLRHGAKLLITDTSKKSETPLTVGIVEKALADYKSKGLKVYTPKWVMGGHREEDMVWADLIVQGPAIPFDSKYLLYAEHLGKKIETDLSLFFDLCPYSTIGITGTRGKTTTTMLVGEIMKLHDKRAVLGGNIRVSPLEVIEKILKSKNAMPIVLEISSWQAEGLARSKQSPHIAALTNLSEDHLNRYGTMEKYAAAKESLFASQTPDDIAIFNNDDEWGRKISKRMKSHVVLTSMSPSFNGNGVFWRKSDLIARFNGKEKTVLTVKDVKLEGQHNLANVAMAVAISLAYGVPAQLIKKAVRGFKGVPDRQEVLRVWKGITFVNDTTATSPEGLRAALARFASKPVVLIGGGTDKALPLDSLAPEIVKRTKSAILFKGTATDKLLAAWPHDALKPAIATSMKEAFDLALGQAKRGDIILLSPGAASFGIFANEFDRGEQFRKLVKKLK